MKTLVLAVTIALGLSAGHVYAQAGSGASAPVEPAIPTPSGDTARSQTLGDPGKPNLRRPVRRRPVASTQNGSAPDRASAGGAGR